LQGLSCLIRRAVVPVVATLLPGLEGPLLVAVPAYCVLLTAMAWRAVASAGTGTAAAAGAMGAALFVVSDGLIGVNSFLTPVPHAQVRRTRGKTSKALSGAI